MSSDVDATSSVGGTADGGRHDRPGLGDAPQPDVIEYPFGAVEAASVLSGLADSWGSVASMASLHRLGVRIGGVPVVIESPDAALFDRLRPALDHHPRLDGGDRGGRDGDDGGGDVNGDTNDDAGRGVVTLRIWTLGAPGAVRPAMPPALVQRADASASGPGGSRVRARFDHANRALMAWDSASDVAWWCLESIDGLEWWEEAAPFRPLLSWILPAHQRHFAHCAAVGSSDGAIVLVGPGGSGKSTTALACHLDGMGYVGDDYCLITNDPVPVVHSLYGTAKVRIGESVESGPLASYMMRATPPAGGKAVALVSARNGAHLVASAPVAVVAAVSVGTDSRTRVHDATRAEVLAALAPNSLQQLPGVTPASFTALSQLVRSTPVCRIELGHDRTEVVAVVRAVLADPSMRRS
jgi:hypothetical protein